MESSADEALALFVADSRQQLDTLENLLLKLERDPADRTVIDAIFRAAHTIKGNAMVVQLGELEWFAHVTESVLERLRSGELQACSDLISVLLACCDHLRYLIVSAAMGDENTPDFAETDRTRLIGMLVAWMGEHAEIAAPVPVPEERLQSLDEGWRIGLKLAPEALRQGLDPLNFLRHLESLGRIHRLTVDDTNIPEIESFDPECCYLEFDLLFDSRASKQAIEDVFSFMGDACELKIAPSEHQLEDWVERIDSLPEHELQTGEMLVRVGALTPEELASGLRVQRTAHDRPIGRILVDEGYVATVVVDAALRRQGEIKRELQRESSQLRVSADKLDVLLASLGGMQNSLNQLAMRGTRVSAVEMVALQHALEKARQLALGLRTARFGEQFRRLHRLVRDTSLELGKRADLLVSGGEIEMDRAMADALGDVLMHLLRNAIDHGLELPAVRQRSCKPMAGSLSVEVFRQTDWLYVRVRDDGAGVDPARVRAVAEARGLLEPGSTPGEGELLALLFEPGFSTAENLSHISGRGVGLDAVRSAVQALGGEISLCSQSGQGCCFEIRMPESMTGALPAITHGAAA